MPFFGCGLVELPPGGHKKTKSSRKMQMTFFVHEGKVLVEVGAKDMEVNRFTLSKGGVWVVPRGEFPNQRSGGTTMSWHEHIVAQRATAAPGLRESWRMLLWNKWLTCAVPGNFYAIDNESKTTTARIFFAQGCEVDLGAASRALQER